MTPIRPGVMMLAPGVCGGSRDAQRAERAYRGRATRRVVPMRTRPGLSGAGEPCGPRRGRGDGHGRRGCGRHARDPEEPSGETLLPPSSSSSKPDRGESSAVEKTAESARNGSHNIIEATASLTSASVISIGQSIATSMLLPAPKFASSPARVSSRRNGRGEFERNGRDEFERNGRDESERNGRDESRAQRPR
jgi:hypothetical protein